MAWIWEGGSRVSRSEYIRIEGLHVSYDGIVPAVSDLNMEVAEGDFVAVLGPSGCGKSTLLHALSGVVQPQSGRIEIAGMPVGTGRGNQSVPIGYVFQDHRLLPWRTVAQNIAIVLRAAGVPDEEIDERIDRYLEMLHISTFRDTWPLRLSGGQRQRVSIARALAVQPAVVLMDEPFSTLDEVTARIMRQQLAELWQESGQTLVFVTHSIREALFLANRVFILTQGPASVFDVITVPVARPRRYEDPQLTELEAQIVEHVMGEWGYGSPLPAAEDEGV
jgi:NitT/TauT family transport system ATP-binding protein